MIRARAQKGNLAVSVFERPDRESDRLFVLSLKRDFRPGKGSKEALLRKSWFFRIGKD